MNISTISYLFSCVLFTRCRMQTARKQVSCSKIEQDVLKVALIEEINPSLPLPTTFWKWIVLCIGSFWLMLNWQLVSVRYGKRTGTQLKCNVWSCGVLFVFIVVEIWGLLKWRSCRIVKELPLLLPLLEFFIKNVKRLVWIHYSTLHCEQSSYVRTYFMKTLSKSFLNTSCGRKPTLCEWIFINK